MCADYVRRGTLGHSPLCRQVLGISWQRYWPQHFCPFHGARSAPGAFSANWSRCEHCEGEKRLQDSSIEVKMGQRYLFQRVPQANVQALLLITLHHYFLIFNPYTIVPIIGAI